MRADVVVIGAGFAGLSAAVRLAELGRSVVVVEQAPRLGGRATSFIDRDTGERVDNGQHALFGCYRETYAFLKRIGTDHLAPIQSQFSLLMADNTGRQSALSAPRLPAPWHLLAGLMRWRAIGLADRASALRLAGLLRQIQRRGARAVADTVSPDMTVAAWLRAHGQSPALCDWLWHPLAIAALNQLPEIAAAAPFVRVLGELFAPDPAAAAIGLPVVPLEDLYGPAAESYLNARNGQVIRKTGATVLFDRGASLDRGASVDSGAVVRGVRAGDTIIDAPVVVSSVPWHAFDGIWDGAPPAAMAAIALAASKLASSPIVTVNLWFDPPAGPVIGAPFVGLVGGPMHWVFCRSAIVGSGAEHISVVVSGADSMTRMDNAEITSLAVAHLRRSLPQIGAHAIRRSVVVREHRATFSLAPGGPARPGTVTPLRGFFLAGDWTDTGLPGTIEGAVQSGHAAAAAVAS